MRRSHRRTAPVVCRQIVPIADSAEGWTDLHYTSGALRMSD